MDKKPTLYVMIGPAGSGKTTFAKRLWAIRVCPDVIRGEMFGDEAAQKDPEAVFRHAYELMTDWMCLGWDVVFDATSTTTKARRKILDQVDAIRCRKVAVFMNTPVEEALRRNAARSRKVPEDVIRKQYAQLYRDAHTIPEQFDEIVVV